MPPRSSVLALLDAGISITLLMDLADLTGLDSAEIFTVESWSDAST